MQCKELETVLESEGLGLLTAEAREHLGSCLSCQGFLADLEAIVSTAKTIPAEVEPPTRVWVSLRAQLEAEGLIREEVEVPQDASWWDSFQMLWRPRSLATAAAGLALVATTFYLTHTPWNNSNTDVAKNPPAPAVSQQAQPAPAPALTPAPTAPREGLVAKNSGSGPVASRVKELAPSPSESASVATLSGDEPDFAFPGLQPAGNAQVEASLRQNLRTLNEFIAECERHLRQNPHDELAREYLNAAYQQKADLLAAMMESGRSEH